MIAGFRLGFGAICLLLFTTNSAEIKTASVLPGLAKVYHRRVSGWPSGVLERLHRGTTFLRFVFGSFFPQLRVFNNFSASFSGSFLATHVACPFVFSNFPGLFLKKGILFCFFLCENPLRKFASQRSHRLLSTGVSAAHALFAMRRNRALKLLNTRTAGRKSLRYGRRPPLRVETRLPR